MVPCPLGPGCKRPIAIPLERTGTERAGDEEGAEVDKIELLARFIR